MTTGGQAGSKWAPCTSQAARIIGIQQRLFPSVLMRLGFVCDMPLKMFFIEV